ncbi:uncharacterized protein PITG_23153 [Phytophthora infestans T30-4]|uniref:Secreted protein n=1 Tax=Phytophthora infestans (strain T30-4) TaxID=403677 RepID=D0NZW1_PHYIT|nr:uncharacterized protein PITG_23153 [Phytophthora infestans T30-4]EEY69677.1 conserved hypothetical protein [Phytophthora infestans T30-4]|eukprot:XP_002997089.1 conserved hypothetical protein [Phytophthora infestans T30-4]
MRPKRLSGRLKTFLMSLLLSPLSAPLTLAKTRTGKESVGNMVAVCAWNALFTASRVAFSGVTNTAWAPTLSFLATAADAAAAACSLGRAPTRLLMSLANVGVPLPSRARRQPSSHSGSLRKRTDYSSSTTVGNFRHRSNPSASAVVGFRFTGGQGKWGPPSRAASA